MKQRESHKTWRTLALLTLLCFLSHGLLINRLGFNWDDWFWLLTGYTQGTKGFHESTSIDRPIMGLWFAIAYSLIGLKPLGWHLLAWVGRWSASLLFWWGLRGLWPKNRLETALAALLFVVYPGFQTHTLPLAASTQYLALNLSLFSLSSMIWARRVNRGGFLLDAAALLAIPPYTLMHEYYAGQELLRPLLLWCLSREHSPSRRVRFRWAARYAWPYLLVFLAVIGYRLFIFQPNRTLGSMYWATDVQLLGGRYLDLLREAPLLTVFRLGFFGLRGMLEALVLGWAPILEVLRVDMDTRSSWVALGLTSASAFLVILYLRSMRQPGDSAGEDRWIREGFVGGLVAVICGLLVHVLVTANPPTAEGMYSRFFLPPLIGTALVIVTTSKRAVHPTCRPLFFGLFIGVSVAANFLNGWAFKKEWDIQRSLWWQLAWRAPQVKPGTFLFIDIPPNPLNRGFRSNYEIAAPANLLYRHGGKQPSLWGFDLRRPEHLKRLLEGGTYSEQQRSLFFQGNLRNALVLHMERRWRTGLSDPCLKVLEPDKPIPDNFESPLIAMVASPYSDPSRIVGASAPPLPPGGVLGEEPPHGWCYFYQRMEYYGQQGDWGEVVRLAEEAAAKGFRPEEPTEALITIEGEGHFQTGER